MSFNLYLQIEHFSKVYPGAGDLLATGTPAGVRIARGRQGMLKIGKVVRVEIERVDLVENKVIAEPRTPGLNSTVTSCLQNMSSQSD